MADVNTINARDPLVLAGLLRDPPEGVESQAQVEAAARQLMGLNRWLEAARLWNLARRSSTPARDPRIDTLALAQEALCISKEKVALRAEDAFTQAVAVLESGDLGQTRDQETLGIAGGIYKRYWDTFRQTQHLQQALAYYQRGWEGGGLADDGYTGINAAYVADVLAYLEETSARRGGAESLSAVQRRRQARDVRLAIVDAAPELEARLPIREQPWWILVTLAEAHFGLGAEDGMHYALAEQYLQRAVELPGVAGWMVETTARQLGAMARMQEAAAPTTSGDSRPWQVLDVLVRRVPGLRTELGGKVGLALSGGGFRASLFHIGVLARLAELDMLRHVEVISCVSGGSILGALYYLRLRDLLTRKRDDEITRDDYVAIVRGLETDFLTGIQQNNFRLRMVENFADNLRMLKNRGSRTEALGRSMGRALYGSAETYLHEIRIQPPDGEPGFRSADYNWRRKNKVPLLVLNATNQADGHGWHFTPYEMGEPQLSSIDSNPRLRPRELGDDHSVHLWRAVAASACVPVLFEPISVPFGDTAVNLLDGGVHDNQGTSALLAYDCTLLLVSDASGQLDNAANAGTSFAAVGLRADSIVQERLRIALYEALESRRRGSLLRGMLFLHLRLGLRDRDDEPTEYGVPTGIQRRLSNIRTDLDVFNDAEALSLMLSGYLMARQQLPEQLPGLSMAETSEHPWAFREIEASVAARPPSSRLVNLLDLGSTRFLKVWRAIPSLRWTGIALLALVGLAGLAWLVSLLWSERVIPVSTIAWTILGFLAGALVERLLRVKIPSWKKEVALAATALTGAAVAWLHATRLDRLYLEAGRRDRL